jgi:hypothetical protein
VASVHATRLASDAGSLAPTASPAATSASAFTPVRRHELAMISQILLGLGAAALCLLVFYLLTKRKASPPPPPSISLHYSRVTPGPHELQRLFVGEVATADVLPGAQGFVLTYTSGRTVQIALVQSQEHWSEDTHITADEIRPARQTRNYDLMTLVS